jgi:hypothetical protein
VPAASVVEDLEIVEHRVRQLEEGAPALAFRSLTCMRDQNGSMTALTLLYPSSRRRGRPGNNPQEAEEGPGLAGEKDMRQPMISALLLPSRVRRAT